MTDLESQLIALVSDMGRQTCNLLDRLLDMQARLKIAETAAQYWRLVEHISEGHQVTNEHPVLQAVQANAAAGYELAAFRRHVATLLELPETATTAQITERLREWSQADFTHTIGPSDKELAS